MPALEFSPQIASHAENMSIQRFSTFLAVGGLRLRPPFQRNLVWNDEQRSFLIDSIMRGLPVPEIYIHLVTSAEGDETATVVDGQQRISACLGFLGGTFRLDAATGHDPRWRGRTFTELPPLLQQRFRSYELVVRKLPADLGEDVLREIFRRLNKTVEPLTPQELRHAAYTGPFLQFVELAAAYPGLTEVGVFTSRDYLRRRSDELLAEICVAVLADAYPNKKEGLDEIFLSYEQHGVPSGVLEQLGQRVGRVLQQIDLMGAQLRRTRFSNKSDFYTLFVTLAKEAERLPLDNAASLQLAASLLEFSQTVNDIKREEAERRSIDKLVESPLGQAALSYLRAVERAASDRLNRVRREESLRVAIGPVIALSSVRSLSADDAGWTFFDPEADTSEELDIDEEQAEKEHLQEVLLSAGDVPGNTVVDHPAEGPTATDGA